MRGAHAIAASFPVPLLQIQSLLVLRVVSWDQVTHPSPCNGPNLLCMHVCCSVPGVIGTMQALEALKVVASAGCILHCPELFLLCCGFFVVSLTETLTSCVEWADVRV